MSTFVTPPLDFDVLREIWNKYELQDHSVLKVKIVLTMVTKAAPQSVPAGSTPPPPSYSIDTQPIVLVLSNERGPPDSRTYSPAELNAAITKSDLRFTTVTQDWNEYVADDGTRIKVQPMLMSVSKTSKFNNKGLPVYFTNLNISVQIKPPGSPVPSLPS